MHIYTCTYIHACVYVHRSHFIVRKRMKCREVAYKEHRFQNRAGGDFNPDLD